MCVINLLEIKGRALLDSAIFGPNKYYHKKVTIQHLRFIIIKIITTYFIIGEIVSCQTVSMSSRTRRHTCSQEKLGVDY